LLKALYKGSFANEMVRVMLHFDTIDVDPQIGAEMSIMKEQANAILTKITNIVLSEFGGSGSIPSVLNALKLPDSKVNYWKKIANPSVTIKCPYEEDKFKNALKTQLSNQTDSVKMIPLLQYLKDLTKGKSKYVMMCLIRPEIKAQYCEGARKGMQFAESVASSGVRITVSEEKDEVANLAKELVESATEPIVEQAVVAEPTVVEEGVKKVQKKISDMTDEERSEFRNSVLTKIKTLKSSRSSGGKRIRTRKLIKKSA